MPWTKHNFPGPVKGLTPGVRAKAISIANTMAAEHRMMEHDFIIAVAISKAREWAHERGRKFDK